MIGHSQIACHFALVSAAAWNYTECMSLDAARRMLCLVVFALLTSCFLVAQEVSFARDAGLVGPVELVNTYTLTYSFQNGVWRAGVRWRSAEQGYDAE